MKKWLMAFAFITMPLVARGAFTEYFADFVNGSNINVGDGGTVVTDVGGSWDSVTSSYTASSGTPFSSAVPGQYASEYVTGKSSTNFIAMINQVGAGGAFLILSSTHMCGQIPATGSGYSLTLGGSWMGPNNKIPNSGAIPFNFACSSMTDPVGDRVRANLRNNAVYVDTIPITHNPVGDVTFQGYSNTPGDGGKATISDAVSSSIALYSCGTGSFVTYQDLIFQSTSTSGLGQMFNGASASRMRFINVVWHGSRIECVTMQNGGSNYFQNVEMYACNASNTSGRAALGDNVNGNNYFDGLYIHDNLGSNNSCIREGISANHFYNNVILSNCGQDGVDIEAASGGGTTIFNNITIDRVVRDGFRFNEVTSIAMQYFINNANISNAGGFGINPVNAPSLRSGMGSFIGFYANTSGNINTANQFYLLQSTFQYTSTPYVNNLIGDYRIKSAQGIGTGLGAYTATASTFTIVSYPDVGAVQRRPFPGGALSVSN